MSSLQDDLSMKMQSDIAAVLDRNLELFRVALDTAEIGDVLVEASLMVAASSAATMAGMVARHSTEADAALIFNHTYQRIVTTLTDKRSVALSRAIGEIRARVRRE